MRHIIKGTPHPTLENRRIQHLTEIAAGAGSQKAWKNFRSSKKAKTRDLCLIEQFGLCAFSEVVLDAADLGMHLDHITPRTKAPDLTFSHSNLLLSAIDDIGKRGLAKDDVFGGHARGSRYSASGFIQPLMSDCRRYFHFCSNGVIEPHSRLSHSERRRAKYSITVMNLNASILITRRRNVIELIEDTVDQLLDDPLALTRFATLQLCPQDGKLLAFHSAARERFGATGNAVLAANFPTCT